MCVIQEIRSPCLIDFKIDKSKLQKTIVNRDLLSKIVGNNRAVGKDLTKIAYSLSKSCLGIDYEMAGLRVNGVLDNLTSPESQTLVA